MIVQCQETFSSMSKDFKSWREKKQVFISNSIVDISSGIGTRMQQTSHWRLFLFRCCGCHQYHDQSTTLARYQLSINLFLNFSGVLNPGLADLEAFRNSLCSWLAFALSYFWPANINICQKIVNYLFIFNYYCYCLPEIIATCKYILLDMMCY